MSMERLSTAEQNIEQIRVSMQQVEKEQTKQGVEISNIKDTLNRFDVTFQEISKTQSAMHATLAAMQATLAVNTTSLNEHMRRTELLENQTSELMKFKWQTMAVIAVLTLIGSYIGGLLPKF